MKILSVTAVLAATLPSISGANSPENSVENKELSSSRIGTQSSEQFTEQNSNSGIEYKVSGDVSFSDFSNIPEDVSGILASPHQELSSTDISVPSSSGTSNGEVEDAEGSQSENNLGESLIGVAIGETLVLTTSTDSSSEIISPTTTTKSTQNGSNTSDTASTTSSESTTLESATAILASSYHLQAETVVEKSLENSEDIQTTPSGSSPKNTVSGGGAFYNPHQAPISFINNLDNPGSLTLSKIRVIGEGGAIYSKGPLSIKDLQKFFAQENLSQKAGGAICGESTISINGVDSISFSKNKVAVPSSNKVDPSDPDSSDHTDVSGSESTTSNNNQNNNVVSPDATTTSQAIALTKIFLSETPGTNSQESESTATTSQTTENENTLNVELSCGGAIYAQDKLTISNSKKVTFDNNSADEKGGAIFTKGEIFLANITETVFSSNVGKKGGGGIYSEKTVTVSQCGDLHFKDNIAGIEATQEYPTVEQSTPTSSKVMASANLGKEGALYIEKSLTINGGTETINFVEDKATDVGGGAVSGETVKIENCSGYGIFSRNQAIDNKDSGSTVDVLGGAVYAKTALNIDSGNFNKTITFSDNTVSSKSTTGQVAGGAIFSPTVTIATPVVFSNNAATNDAKNSRKNTFGGAIGATTAVSLSKGARFSKNTADLGSAIGLVPAKQNTETVKLEADSYYFENNKAIKRATIYAPIVSIKAYTATFNQNSSAEEGSAIYFTKEATIESLGSILFTGNLVTPTQSTTTQTAGNTTKYGAAIFGQIVNSSESQTDNLPLKLIASKGNICFRNNEYRPSTLDTGASTFCSIAGDVKLTMQATEGKTISFFDAIRTTTKKTGTQASTYDSLDINKNDDSGSVNSAFTGTVMFSSELHENKSYIPQNVVLHSGSLVLRANTELHVISFEQKEGASLVMEPGAVLSNQTVADGSLVVNNLTIDLSSVGRNSVSDDNIFTPPELRIVDTTTNFAKNRGVSEGSNSSSDASQSSSTTSTTAPTATTASLLKNPATVSTTTTTTPTTGNQVILDGVIKLIDPNGTFFQNPALGSDQQISLLVLPKDQTKLQAQKVVLTGDVSPVKGYTGTLTLDPNNLKNGVISALWTFKSYRQWAYVPRDNHFYANSILGSQMSMATVKQGLMNDKLSLARFDEIAYNNLWISGLGTILSQKDTPYSEEFTYYSRGASVALDAKPAQDVIIGAAFSKMVGKTKSLKKEHNYTHKGSEYSYQASIYGGSPFHFVINKNSGKATPFLLQGVISYGYIKHDTVTHYPTIRERNKGEWEDLGWLAALRLSSNLKSPSQSDTKRFTVYGELEYSSVCQKQFTETEYDPRYFGSCTYRNLAVPIGLAAEGEFTENDILMYNRFSIAYMPSIYRNSPVCKYQVLSSGDGGEIICGVPTRNSARMEYSTQLYLGPLWTLYGSYTLEVDAHTLAHMTNCGARMTF